MRMFLNITRWGLGLVWTGICITLAIVATVLTLNRSVALKMARRLWGPGLLAIAGARMEVEPLPDVDWTQPHIYLMNHQSLLDIPAAFAALPGDLRFVAKHSLAYVPFLGWYMWMTRMVFINRADRVKALESLRQAGQRIREGANILAYPEGTRELDGRLLPFKKGPFALALEAGVPVIPVAIEGSGRVMASGSIHIIPGRVRLKVGTPIPTTGRAKHDREALLIEVRDALAKLHREIGGAGPTSQAVALPGQEGLSVPVERAAAPASGEKLAQTVSRNS